jgi:hypothetical protein
MRRALLILVIAVTGLAALSGTAAAQRVLTSEEAQTQIRADLGVTFLRVPDRERELVLGFPVFLGVESCERLTPFKIECVGRVESTGPQGEIRVCLVPGEVAHRAMRGRSISVTGNGPITCRLIGPSAQDVLR